MQKNYRILGSVLIGTLALAIIGSYFIYSNTISKIDDSSTLINIAGKQRMLSQSIVKEFLLSKYISPTEASSLDAQITLFKNSHRAILNGDQDLNIGELDRAYILDFQTLDANYRKFVNLFPDDLSSASEKDLIRLAEEQRVFLKEMNRFVGVLANGSNQVILDLAFRIGVATVALLLLVIAIYFILVTPSSRELEERRLLNKEAKIILSGEVIANLEEMVLKADTINYHNLSSTEADKIDGLRLGGKNALKKIKKEIEKL
jgi:hypothetical protein